MDEDEMTVTIQGDQIIIWRSSEYDIETQEFIPVEFD